MLDPEFLCARPRAASYCPGMKHMLAETPAPALGMRQELESLPHALDRNGSHPIPWIESGLQEAPLPGPSLGQEESLMPLKLVLHYF